MPYSRSGFLLLAFLCHFFNMPAQRARYTDEYKRIHNITITGFIKNNLHAWSADAFPSRFQDRDVTLTLHIFSPEMRAISEHSVPLGKIKQWDIDFQLKDNFYYANIVYFAGKRKTLLLKVDPSGTVTDMSASPELWTKPNFPTGNNRLVAASKKGNNFFAAFTQSVPANDSTISTEFLRLPMDSTASGDVLEQLVISKVNMHTKEWAYQVFGSWVNRFYRPLIHITDSSVLVAATTEQKKDATVRAPRNGPLLLVARLDTSLTDSSARMSLLRSTNGKKDETYAPFEIFPIQKKLAIFSNGVYQRETYYFSPGGAGVGPMPAPRMFRAYFVNSLKITLLDENSRLLKDTIIEKKFGAMQWDNFFSTSSARSIDLFCMRKYAGNKNGITRFSINGDGAIYEEDMIVDIKNEYNLSQAKETSPGVLIIPFTRKARAGLVRLEFRPVE